MEDVIFRKAVREDLSLIYSFIKELAEYQHLEDQMIATEESLEKLLFEENRADVIFCVYRDVEVGFAVYYKTFSTLLGKCGIHLEDLYVKPEYRRHGFGRAILRKLAQITRDQGFERLEWCCLNWNESSIAFYLSIGAAPMSEWTTYRLTGDALKKVIES
jgi:GNAT superfamily N-acetyltransferase